jgi:ribose 5-phosphate isomerase B
MEDDRMNIICLAGRTMGIAVAWLCTKSFLAVKFSGAERRSRRLAKVIALDEIASPHDVRQAISEEYE